MVSNQVQPSVIKIVNLPVWQAGQKSPIVIQFALAITSPIYYFLLEFSEPCLKRYPFLK